MRPISADLARQLQKATAALPTETAVAAAEGAAITPREAVLEAMFLVAAVDGHVSTLEVAQFAEGVEAVLGADADGDVQALVRKMADRLSEEGWQKRLASVERALVGTEHAEQAYRLAASVAFVDDAIEHAEAAALEALAGAFGISDDRAHAIMGEVRAELFGD